MPRKTSTAAAQDYLQADYDRWRLVARNRDFRKDLAEYLNKCGSNLSGEWRKHPVLSQRLLNKFGRLQKQYLQKWGIERVPDPALWQEEEWIITTQGLERWYQAARQEQADFATGISCPAYISNLRRGSRHKEMLVEFRLDLNIPVDRLLAHIDKELRAWYWKHIGEHPRGKPASLDFHLKVFDLFQQSPNGKRLTFLDVARKLKQKPSTIRDAYIAACRKIGIASLSQKPNAESLPHPGNISECPNDKCRNAKTAEDFCLRHRADLKKLEVSQKDLLLRGSSDIEHTAARHNFGRRQPWSDTFSDD